MKSLFSWITGVSLPLYLLFTPSLVRAAEWANFEGTNCLRSTTVTLPDGTTETHTDIATIQCLEPLFANVVGAVVSIAGVALFLMLVVGGFKFMTSGGDPKNLEQAKKTITYAVLGLLFIVIAYLILATIEAFTGVRVTQFTIPGAN